jgi:hypothetical protein
LAKPLGRLGSEPRWALGDLVDADERLEPPRFALLVDLALTDEEGGVEQR